MKRLAAFVAALMLLISVPFCAFGLDENYAIEEYYHWEELEETQVELINQPELEGSIKYYIDAEDRTAYFHLAYKTECLISYDEGNIVYIMADITRDGKTQRFFFDKDGFLNGSGKGFELATYFSGVGKKFQYVLFAFQCPKSHALEGCRLQLSISVNGNSFDFLDYTVASAEETTTKPAEKESQTTEKAETTTSAETTKPSKETSTTKFTPPADADYFGDASSEDNGSVTVTEEYGAEQIIEAPEAEEELSLSNPAKIAIACAAALALIGAGLITKAAVSSRNKKSNLKNQPKAPKIDEESKEIIDRYIDDDFDLDE